MGPLQRMIYFAHKIISRYFLQLPGDNQLTLFVVGRADYWKIKIQVIRALQCLGVNDEVSYFVVLQVK
jgi:hypothetical protein